MHYVISTLFISHMQIYHHACIYIIKVHKTCYAHSSSISPKISSHGLIYNYEQFDLNYSTKHMISQKYFVILFTITVKPSGYCSRPINQYRFHFVNPNFIVILGLIHTTIQFIEQFIPLTTQTFRGQSRTIQMGFKNFHSSVPRFGTESNGRSRPQANRIINKALKSRVKQVG